MVSSSKRTELLRVAEGVKNKGFSLLHLRWDDTNDIIDKLELS